MGKGLVLFTSFLSDTPRIFITCNWWLKQKHSIHDYVNLNEYIHTFTREGFLFPLFLKQEVKIWYILSVLKKKEKRERKKRNEKDNHKIYIPGTFHPFSYQQYRHKIFSLTPLYLLSLSLVFPLFLFPPSFSLSNILKSLCLQMNIWRLNQMGWSWKYVHERFLPILN